MLIFDNARITGLGLHKVGNKNLDQGYTASTQGFPLDDALERQLRTWFFKPFQSESLFQFHHEASLNLNKMYAYAKRVFGDPERTFLNTGPFILEHLYNCSDHPQVKPGEVFIAYLADCIVDDEMCDAIGIFKSEHRDLFLTVKDEREGYESWNMNPAFSISSQDGIYLGKLDKGVIIFNTAPEDGYRMAIVTAGGQDAHYWKDQFLHVEPAKNASYLTQEMLRMARDFSQDVFAPEQKTAKAEFLGKAFTYFQEKETFDPAEFAEAVLDKDEEKREKLTRYQKSFADEIGLPKGSGEGFAIAHKAVKSAKAKFRSTIKLDTGVEIHINPVTAEVAGEHIERAFDAEKGMFCYKVWFMEES